MIKIIIFLFSFAFSMETKLLLNSKNRISNDINSIVGIMVQFQTEDDQETDEIIEDDLNTTGNGHFLMENVIDVDDRCNGFIVDRPPHNKDYFYSQLLSVSNYFDNVSNGQQKFETLTVLDKIYELQNPMAHYSQNDSSLTNAFKETLILAKDDIISLQSNDVIDTDNTLLVVFHAGVGQDFAVPFLDPTPYDLSSAYIDPLMLDGWDSISELGFTVNHGIILPETQNHIFYDVIEDLFFNETDYCDYQIGLTGIFSLLVGYAIGLPPMYNTETGEAGVGVFGLMDYGSNNGRGVIPSPPTAWSKIYMGWEDPIVIENQSYEQQYDFSIDNSQIYKLIISENEYFLIENRNNWIQYKADMDSLRIKNKLDDNTLGYWFDTFFNETLDYQKNIDPITNVLLEVDNYNYGIPGSGILIWHINEKNINDYTSLNNDPNNRVVHLEEADGAIDIGFTTTALFADPTKGWRWDFWFNDNPAFFQLNLNFDSVSFNNSSLPNTNSSSGSQSLISISNFSDIENIMNFTISYNNDLAFDLINEGPINIIGNSNINEKGQVYFTKDNFIFQASINNNLIELDSILNENNFNQVLFNENCDSDTFMTKIELGKIKSLFFEDNECKIETNSELFLKGYQESLDQYNDILPATGNNSLGDLDLDGFDELVEISSDSSIYVYNRNGILSDGFPVLGKFFGIPLISNILHDDENPEIILRENNDIIIISYLGKVKKRISSYDQSSLLALVPNWRENTIGLLDGNRLLLFDQDLDNTYWLNEYGRSSNLPIVSGKIDRQLIDNFSNINGIDVNRAYNYPNPITDSRTTFRFYTGLANEAEIKIYSASGFLVEKLRHSNLTVNEFNEIEWDASDFQSGLYFAEIRPNVGESALVRVVVVK
ncbi:MAG: hypothetical protein CMG07_00385 [Candidatus Marinimicrobia bacterium]|nr:hypothetical protein [Candidatus Neomarinimicrobiota bacterium]